MNHTSRRNWFITASIIVAVALGSYAWYKKTGQNATTQRTQEKSLTNQIAPLAQTPETPSTKIYLQLKKGKRLSVSWENLPLGTIQLNIFIARQKSGDWSLWKTITISQNQIARGSLEFAINQSVADGGYSFYLQALSAQSQPVWTSPPTQPTTVTQTRTSGSQPPQPPATTNPPAGTTTSGTSGSQPATNPTTTSATTSTSATSTASTTQTSTSTTASGTTTYYNPQGTASTTTTSTTSNFSVQHINNTINISWQNISAGSDNAVVSRSPSANGPWAAVFNQQNPATSYSIGIVDGTVNSPYYYKMDLFRSGLNIGGYGPLPYNP